MKNSIMKFIAGLDQAGKNVTRLAIIVIFLWIGGLKFFTYEADGIVPFVANSPFMSFFYKHPAEYKKHLNKEGELIAANRLWQTDNGTYLFSEGLGTFLVLIAVLVALYKVIPVPSMIASMLIIIA